MYSNKAMKVIAMYLPQFHTVKENNDWWGEGYTEWTAVKAAKSLFDGHAQPRIPLHNNYYDLLDKETMRFQEKLLKQYQVDGLCIYHYWFKDGKKILEKPAENLLAWKDISIPFCFCWANESWARSWSNIYNKNVWTDKFEKKDNIQSSGILIEQKYGTEDDWRMHFEYLLSFFNDERYIKINNCPVFIIYKAAIIPCLNRMINKWREWALDAGLDGIYVIGANGDSETRKYLNAQLLHEPQEVIRGLLKGNSSNYVQWLIRYEEAWTMLLNRIPEEKTYYGGFVGYDDTPRRGENGCVIVDDSPEKFELYLTELLAKNYANGNEVVFLNAWNEWGEGMYLEPDERFGNQYLEVIPRAKKNYLKYVDKYTKSAQIKKEELIDKINEIQEQNVKYRSYWRILDKWLFMKERNISITKYFEENNIHSIGLYGVGMLGKHLIEELKDTDLIKFGIDRVQFNNSFSFPVYSMADVLPEVDAIIVTVEYELIQIEQQLKEKNVKKVLGLFEILESL